MAVLSLLRHAKAAQPLAGQQDFDRPLTERGRDDAAWVGKVILDLGVDLALVSAARRTRETWEIAGRANPTPANIAVERALYLCQPAKLIARIRETSGDVQSVVVVGHNPGIHEAALWLARASDTPAAAKLREKFPTAALAIFSLDQAGWDTLAPDQVKFERFITPRMDD